MSRLSIEKQSQPGRAGALNNRAITRVMSFTSGKGGVGKTNTVLNLAIALAREGRRVLVFDADLGLANLDVLLGLRVEHTLHDVLEGRRSMQEIMVDGPEGIRLIPASSGVESICNLNASQRLQLLSSIEEVASQFDYLLIDTGAGIGAEVMYFNSASSEIVCVINGEPTSLTDAYAMIKILSRNYGEKSISILVNNVSREQEADLAFKRLAKSVDRFLQVQLKYLGFIPYDISISDAVREQRALLDIYPSSSAGRAFVHLARRVDEDFWDMRVKGGMQFFFKQILEANSSGF